MKVKVDKMAALLEWCACICSKLPEEEEDNEDNVVTVNLNNHMFCCGELMNCCLNIDIIYIYI